MWRDRENYKVMSQWQSDSPSPMKRIMFFAFLMFGWTFKALKSACLPLFFQKSVRSSRQSLSGEISMYRLWKGQASIMVWEHMQFFTYCEQISFFNWIKKGRGRTSLPGADEVHCMEIKRINPVTNIFGWLVMVPHLWLHLKKISAHAGAYIVASKEQRAHERHTYVYTHRCECILQNNKFIKPCVCVCVVYRLSLHELLVFHHITIWIWGKFCEMSVWSHL